MGKLTLEIHHNDKGWLEAAELNFKTRETLELAYDLDYAGEFEGKRDCYALSVQYPVDYSPMQGPIPGFVLDLIPQGEPLKRLMRRHKIAQEHHLEEILTKAPLASPGNIRVKEAWQGIERERPGYQRQGFTRDDVITYQSDFIEYMEKLGVPIGGTSSAGGGSPKFLLREDDEGRFHPDGMLDDSKTKDAWLIKFPYTDSRNSKLISQVEKRYYDFIRTLPLVTGDAIEIFDDVLFIKRFDRKRDSRKRDSRKRLCYHGLESLYSAHNINIHGSPLWHEDNLKIIGQVSTCVVEDIIEYLKRDLLNTILANPDNHGGNTSLIKKEGEITLSPLYDVTAMKFFKSEPITRLTRWKEENKELDTQVNWIVTNLKIPRHKIMESLKEFYESLGDVAQRLKAFDIPKEFIDDSQVERNACLVSLQNMLK